MTCFNATSQQSKGGLNPRTDVLNSVACPQFQVSQRSADDFFHIRERIINKFANENKHQV